MSLELKVRLLISISSSNVEYIFLIKKFKKGSEIFANKRKIGKNYLYLKELVKESKLKKYVNLDLIKKNKKKFLEAIHSKAEELR